MDDFGRKSVYIKPKFNANLKQQFMQRFKEEFQPSPIRLSQKTFVFQRKYF